MPPHPHKERGRELFNTYTVGGKIKKIRKGEIGWRKKLFV
jgi:hypothetical protein